MKLIYPSDGLIIYCKDNLETSIYNLKQSMGLCTFYIPDDFVYQNYLYGLKDEIGKLASEANSLNLSLCRVDENYKELSRTLEDEVQTMEVVKIKERDRMIV